MSLAITIRDARVARKLSQRQLSERLGVSDGVVSAYEAGKMLPSVEVRIGLSRILQLPFTDLLPEAKGTAALVTDPTLVAILRLLERMPARRRESMLKAIALLMGIEAPDPPLPNNPSTVPGHARLDVPA